VADISSSEVVEDESMAGPCAYAAVPKTKSAAKDSARRKGERKFILFLLLSSECLLSRVDDESEGVCADRVVT
jgi:hypothetical protein